MITLTLQVGGRCLDEAIVCAQTKKNKTLKWQNANESVGEMGEEMAGNVERERESFFVRFVRKKVFVGVSFVGMKEVQSIIMP